MEVEKNPQENIPNISKNEPIEEQTLRQGDHRNIVFATIIVFIIVVIGIYFLMVYKARNQQNQAQDEISITPHTTSTPSATLQTKPEFTIDLPDNLKITDSRSFIKIQTTDEIIASFDSAKREGGCPGPCGMFAEDSTLVEKQFEILTTISQIENCKFPDDVIAKVQRLGDFGLFASAIESKFLIDGIYNPSLGICGIKYVASDGFDVWIGNYKYKAGFIKENKVIHIEFELFPSGVFPAVDKLLESFGYNKNGFNDCDDECYEKEVEYIRNIDMSDPIIREVIGAYDKSVASFKLH